MAYIDSMRSNPIRSMHIVGLAGSGMSALAQFYAMEGIRVSGSDRIFDNGGGSDMQHRLSKVGVRIVPQDGSGVVDGLDCIVLSTAVTDSNLDLDRARELGIQVKHRSDCLKEIVDSHKTVVIAGTSGKSTVSAMTWEILSSNLDRVSVVTGGPIIRLRDEGFVGNAFNANGEALVVEGDESDGTLVKYEAPHLSVLLNLGKDHKEIEELERIFGEFLRSSSSIRIFADAENLARFRDPSFYEGGPRRPDIATFGFASGDLRVEYIELTSYDSRFSIAGVRFSLPVPGRHNVFNALAAVSAAQAYGIPIERSAEVLGSFSGVYRRYQVLGECDGIRVVDDFAHNPDKIRAAIATAQLDRTDQIDWSRVLAIYQPHGFFPTKFLRSELVAAFLESLHPHDHLWLPDIYNASGPPDPSISSADVIRPIAAAGRHARYVPTWTELAGEVAAEARPGDVVLVMGARDPSLHDRALGIFDAIRTSRSSRLV
jgi:UDP-N-acetylmuramate-alanine ligase